MKKLYLLILCAFALPVFSQNSLKNIAAKKADSLQTQVVAWRRDFHANPELGNHEFRTADIIASGLLSVSTNNTANVSEHWL